MSQITLGECLSIADDHFMSAETVRPPGVRDYAELAVQGRRLISVLERCLDGALAADLAGGEQLSDWQLAVAGICEGLRAAGACLDRALPVADHPAGADPGVERYARAVDALAAGNDLLRTHLTMDAEGLHAGRTDWAPLLVSEPVVTALTAEAGKWAGRAARMVDRILNVPGQVQGLPRTELAAARDWLTTCADAGKQAAPEGRGIADGDGRDLLRAFPPASVPERVVPTGIESDAELCAGIALSAHRLHMAAFTMARQPGSSPNLSGPAWRRTAQASAIVCDLGAHALELLAQPSSLAASGISGVRLRAAADVLMQAREMWRQTAWMWQAMTTDTSSTVSVTTADASDLVLRMGRLVFGDREWTPAGTRRLQPRDPASLASGTLGPAAVLSAVHEAADAIACMARADLDAIRSVHRAGRMYMSNKTLGDLSTKRAYAAAPADRVHILENAYYLCADTGARAVTVLDGLSAETGAPSGILALIHAASPSSRRVGDPEPGFILDPAAFADRLELFGWHKGRPRGSKSQLDTQAVVRDYKDNGLSVQQCADAFAITPDRVRDIVRENGHQLRNERPGKPRDGDSEPQLPRIPGPQPGPLPGMRLYQQLKAMEIDDRACCFEPPSSITRPPNCFTKAGPSSRPTRRTVPATETISGACQPSWPQPTTRTVLAQPSSPRQPRSSKHRHNQVGRATWTTLAVGTPDRLTIRTLASSENKWWLSVLCAAGHAEARRAEGLLLALWPTGTIETCRWATGPIRSGAAAAAHTAPGAPNRRNPGKSPAGTQRDTPEVNDRQAL